MLLNNTITLQQKILHHPQMMQDFYYLSLYFTPTIYPPRIAKRSRKSKISALIHFGTLLEHIIIPLQKHPNENKNRGNDAILSQ